MKKKMIMMITMILLVAVAAFAATPVLSGNFNADYKFLFDGTTADPISDHVTGELALSVKDDYWKITFGAFNPPGGLTAEAQLDVYLDKSLEAIGYTLPVTLTGHFGNMTQRAYTVYANPTGASALKGVSGGFTKANLPVAFDIGYESVVATRLGYDFLSKAFLASAKITPLEGISAAAGFATQFGSGSSNLQISAAADIAELADLDFDLAVSAVTNLAFSGATAFDMGIAVSGGMNDFSAYIEYTGINTHSLNLGVEYEGIENLALDASVGLKDFSNLTVSYEANAAYTLTGVTYKLGIYGEDAAVGMKIGLGVKF